MECKEYQTRTGKPIRLWNGDCMKFMEGLPDNNWDLAIVDPPYGNGTKADIGTGEYSRNWLKNRNGNWDERPKKEYFVNLFTVSKNQAIFGANFFALPPSRGYACWYKTNELKDRDFSEFELIYTSFDIPSRLIEEKPFIRNGARIHPTQKPVKLYRKVLERYATPGDHILDTHGGSMSLAIACYEEGFALDVIELDKDYYTDAVKRFEQHISQQSFNFNNKEVAAHKS